MASSSLGANVRWFFRALSPTHNPLRRAIDRFESVFIALVALGALLAVPVAATVGSLVHDQGMRAAAEASVTLRRVEAVLLQDGPVASPGPDGGSGEGGSRAQASWPGADGKPHVDWIPVRTGSKAGSTVPLWVDPADHVSSPPANGAQVTGSAVIAASGTLLGIEFLCAILIFGAHSLAVMAASRAWQYEWEVVEPQWRRMQL
jgi:hypothetical protein